MMLAQRLMVMSSSSSSRRAMAVVTTVRAKSTRAAAEPAASAAVPWDAASGFFSSMRWRAARALTASLQEEERDQLLRSLVPRPTQQQLEQPAESTEPDGLSVDHSIAEAVAAAKAAESQRYAQKWAREKEALQREAERAARARVESELAVIQRRRLASFQQWQKQLEQERAGQTNGGSTPAATEETTATSKEEEEEVHPILGPTVLDLGYKRLHVCSASSLASLAVWKKQRIYRHDRARSMAADKVKTMHLGFPGVIAIHEDAAGKLSILDGQHRVGMMTILAEKQQQSKQVNGDTVDLENILVEVYPQAEESDDNHAQDLFLEINKAEPVKLVDLPGVAKAADRRVITEAANRLQEQYPAMFSTSTRCRPPHVHIDNVRDALFASAVLSRHGIKTAAELTHWMLAQNEMLATKYQDEEAKKTVSKTALAKADKFKFFLGLESSWYYN
jgi:hypothetical protein